MFYKSIGWLSSKCCWIHKHVWSSCLKALPMFISLFLTEQCISSQLILFPFITLCVTVFIPPWVPGGMWQEIEWCWINWLVFTCHVICLPCVAYIYSGCNSEKPCDYPNWSRIPNSLDLYSLRRHRLTGIGIPMINLRRSDDRLRFIMGIPILIRRRLLNE